MAHPVRSARAPNAVEGISARTCAACWPSARANHVTHKRR